AECVAEAWADACGLWIPRDVLYAPAWTDSASFRSELSALLGGATVDFHDAYSGGTPSLETMLNYAAIFTWANYPYGDPVSMGNNLADYVDAGGRVILGQWCKQSDQGNYLQGRIMDDPGYCPVLACSTSFGSGAYNNDGTMCPHDGPAGLVGNHDTQYLDMVTSIAPDAMVDGTIASTTYSVVSTPDASVWYLPGFTGTDFGTGDWVVKAANVVICSWEVPGACCNVMTAECQDGILIPACIAMGPQWKATYQTLCVDLVPPCGDPGACCDIHSGACVDEVLAAVCRLAGHVPHSGIQCGELEPACGDPGCCCDFPEPGYMVDPYFAFRANCAGRFISGAFVLCGDLDESGVVDMTDYNMFLDGFGQCTGQPGFYAAADLDGDGCITLVDFQQWRNCYQFQGTDCYAEAFDPPCGEQTLSCNFDPGTAAPPPDLCGQEMTPFPPDPRPTGTNVTDLPAPCSAPGAVIGFDIPMGHRRIGSGWVSWSHGYTGDLYYTNGATSITMTMPAGTLAAYFYVEPNPFAEHTFEVTLNGSYVCSQFTAHGSAGAAYVGVCGSPVETVTVTCTSGVDFAVGEFGIKCVDVPGACCDSATGFCTDDVMASECTGRFEAFATCDELSPECGNPGACCDDDTGECVDDVLELQCMGSRFFGAFLCAAFDPPCGELPVPPCPVDGWVLAPGAYAGDTNGAGSDCALRSSQDNYVAVYFPWPGAWTIDLCATSPTWDTYLYLGSDCCTSTWYNDDGCTTAGVLSIINANISTPGVYIATVEAYSATVSGAYVLTVSGPPSPGPGACCDVYAGECEDDVVWQDCVGSGIRFVGDTLCEDLNPPCTPCVDVELIAPGAWSGDTTGAGDHCALRAGQDITVKVTVPTDGNWRFDLCSSSTVWDTYMYIGTDCCQSTWYNDDGCGNVLSALDLTGLPAGDYYVDIEPYSASVTGPVTLTVSELAPADRSAAPATVAPTKLEQLTPVAR
ncbi:MAG: hypothetical protein KBH81_04505, partial [Phycisphaerae bacterium]|nr:hypothetical protein [Phycisphaerae bacterium]